MIMLKMWYSGYSVKPSGLLVHFWHGYDTITGEWYTLFKYSSGEYYMRKNGGSLFRVTVCKKKTVPFLAGGYDLVNNRDRLCYLYY